MPNFHEPNLIRIKADPNYLDPCWIDSDADLNSSRTKFKRTKMLISAKLLKKYVIIIYALGSVPKTSAPESKSLQMRNSRPGQAKGTAEPFQIETGVPNWFRRRTYHVLNSMY